jgi:lactoylglutathione lyase
MTRISHVALWTHDIERLAAFYARHFGAAVGERYVNAARGFSSRFLTFEEGARLELMSRAQLPPADPPGSERMGLTHLALSVGSERRVDELTAQLRGAGCAVVGEPRRSGDGYYESVVLDPDGNRIEISV